jgi:hypothetical protein
MKMSHEDFDAGERAGRQWLENDARGQLSEEQYLALPRNLARIYNNPGDLVHRDDSADHAADAYAALTGDLECHSRATVERFWAGILPRAASEYSEEFFFGFLHGVASGVY